MASGHLKTQHPAEWTELLESDKVDIEGEPESLVHLREGRRLLVLRHENAACIFLDPESGCSVHAERPSACRTYPFDRSEQSPGRVLALHPEFLCPPESNAQRLNGSDESNACAEEFLNAIKTRDAEISTHAEWVQAWNAEQRSRLRLRRLPLASAQFLQRLSSNETD